MSFEVARFLVTRRVSEEIGNDSVPCSSGGLPKYGETAIDINFKTREQELMREFLAQAAGYLFVAAKPR